MPGSGSDEAVVMALRLAVRAPSARNCQPWRWLVGPGTVHLYADGSRQVPATDPHGRDLLISCGAALNHLLVALASLGWDARVRRMPNPARPGHLATVQPFPLTATTASHDLAAAIPRRRTDRRRFSSWPVPAELIGEMLELAQVYGVGLEAITEPTLAWKVFRAIATAAGQQVADPAYVAEIAAWSGRGTGSDDGVPAASAPVPQHTPGQMPLRDYARPTLPTRPGTGEPENATLLLLTTPTDNALDWLRAGEATSPPQRLRPNGVASLRRGPVRSRPRRRARSHVRRMPAASATAAAGRVTGRFGTFCSTSRVSRSTTIE